MMIGDTYTIPMENSWLCVTCSRIGSDATQCPACAAREGLLPLVTVLNRSTGMPMPSARIGLFETIAQLEAAFEFKTSDLGVAEEGIA